MRGVWPRTRRAGASNPFVCGSVSDGRQCTKHITAIGTANAAKRTTEKINIFFMATSLLGVLKKLPEPAKAIRDRDHDLEVLADEWPLTAELCGAVHIMDQ